MYYYDSSGSMDSITMVVLEYPKEAMEQAAARTERKER